MARIGIATGKPWPVAARGWAVTGFVWQIGRRPPISAGRRSQIGTVRISKSSFAQKCALFTTDWCSYDRASKASTGHDQSLCFVEPTEACLFEDYCRDRGFNKIHAWRRDLYVITSIMRMPPNLVLLPNRDSHQGRRREKSKMGDQRCN